MSLCDSKTHEEIYPYMKKLKFIDIQPNVAALFPKFHYNGTRNISQSDSWPPLVNLLFQSKTTQGCCFTEFTTLSMLTIILSKSNVLNFVSIFHFSQRKPKAFDSHNLRLYLY